MCTCTQIKCLKYLHIGNKRPFPCLEILHLAISAAFSKAVLQRYSHLWLPSRAARGSRGPHCLWAHARCLEMLGDVGWVLGGDMGQSVLAPPAEWIPRSAVQAVCQDPAIVKLAEHRLILNTFIYSFICSFVCLFIMTASECEPTAEVHITAATARSHFGD